mmetsp:Transcript_1602/g.3927  ORF Transcript_1602/g.3927 Transcript_1602/m.3927 type:complete len:263 (-) Transcript_1602:404-1192(-)
MALPRALMSSGLFPKALGSAAFARMGGGAASGGFQAMAFTSSSDEEDRSTVADKGKSQASSSGQPALHSLAGLARCGSPAGLLLPSRPLGRLGGLSTGPRSTQQFLQQRGYNAWSPAQRYFVEGDHVVAAEANRTLQFTGLDSGSFYPFFIYTVVATTIASVFTVVPFLVAPARVDLDKSSAYECGFDAFGDSRQQFSVSFYLVAIMYLLFDIEIAYLFPYVMCHANGTMFWTMNLFLGILTAGFIYEWGVGALEWRESGAH